MSDVNSIVRAEIKNYKQYFLTELYAFMETTYAKEAPTPNAFSDSSKLRSTFTDNDRNGKPAGLPLSFRIGNKNSLSRYIEDDKSISIHLESNLPYASIQETGGFIADRNNLQAPKKLKKGGGRAIMMGNMQRYFWGMYLKEKLKFFMIVALSIRKKGGIHLKARPYFYKALKEFETERLPQLLNELIHRIGIKLGYS